MVNLWGAATKQPLGALFAGIVASLALLSGLAQAAKPAPALYSYYAVGTVGSPVGSVAPKITLPKPTYPSYVLMGGGPDVDQAFRWMIQKAGISQPIGGRLVVIRTTGDGAYNPYIYYSNKRSSTKPSDVVDGWVGGASLGLTSVETLVIPSVEAAKNSTVNAIVANANAVWIAGGDQSTYIRFWKGTPLEATLKNLMANNVPIGGTSAGLAVMGGFDYSALNASATSPLSLQNPYYSDITFDPSPLSTQGGFIAPEAFKDVIFDSHLDSRDRMGRLVTFVSRLVGPYAGTATQTYGCPGGVLGNSQARGIGVGVEAALLVAGSPDGYIGERVTNVSTSTESAVYFVDVTMGPTQCLAGKPLDVPTSSVAIRKLATSGRQVNLTRLTDPVYGLPVYKWGGVSYGTLTPTNPY
jgi:cyanophycinase-like exopeptidase